nr:nitrate reductase molybdenum cofactor assembly chaperone [Staphylococcus hyicus]
MEGSSVINLETLKYFKETFAYMSQQLSFPEKLTFHPKTFDAIFSEDHPAYPHVKAYRERMYELSLSEIKSLYTDTFDFNKKTTLYMTFNKFDTQKERGQMLAKLKVLYEMFGLEMPASELSDYLPLMLEFLYAAPIDGDHRAQENMQLLIMIIEDGTYPMMKYLEEKGNPYSHLIRGLRETLKRCIVQDNEVTQHV